MLANSVDSCAGTPTQLYLVVRHAKWLSEGGEEGGGD